MIAIDHVIAVVTDLDRAAASLFDEHGLASLAGGRHQGHGTGNRIVPLGDTYLELMAVLDTEEAAGSPMGRWAASHASADLHPVGLCLRTEAIDDVGHILGEEPVAMSRLTPDGRVLSWHLVGLDGMLADGLPFFIGWTVAPRDHPGAATANHSALPDGITEVVIGPVPEPLGDLIDGIPGLVVGDSAPGVRSITIATAAGPVTLVGSG